MKLIKIILGVISTIAVFFALTFMIYFLNLDMKMAEKIMPIITKHYDQVKRQERL